MSDSAEPHTGALAGAELRIRTATSADWPLIWRVYREIVSAGETYALPLEMTSAQGRAQWMQAAPGATFVAQTPSAAIIGSASVYPNRGGGGGHVASASFMVDRRSGRRGVGRALAAYALNWSRAQGFSAMQFNAVVETNTAAVKLWESLGFQIIGTVPQAFNHPVHGLVGLHVMHRFL